MKQLITNNLTGQTIEVDVENPINEFMNISQPTLEDLKLQLSSTDYKIIKCYEYQLAGLSLPYDIIALHEERQSLRDQINAMEVQ